MLARLVKREFIEFIDFSLWYPLLHALLELKCSGAVANSRNCSRTRYAENSLKKGKVKKEVVA